MTGHTRQSQPGTAEEAPVMTGHTRQSQRDTAEEARS